MHVVDDIHRVDIEGGQRAQHPLIVREDGLIVQGPLRQGLDVIEDANRKARLLVLFYLIHAAVDGVEQGFGQVGAGSKELHLFADSHGRDTAGDGVIIPIDVAHQVVVFVLDGGGLNGQAGTVGLEGLGQLLTPQHRHVWLGCGGEGLQGVEEAVAGPGYEAAPIQAHAADGFCHPGRVAAKELVVLRGAQVANQTELDDQLVDEFLGLILVQQATVDVVLDVDVEEGRVAAHAHRRPVIFLYRCQVGEVQVLDRLTGILCRAGNIVAVAGGHGLDGIQGANLLGEFLAQTDLGRISWTRQSGLVTELGSFEVVDTIEGDAAVITNDAAAAIGVRQARQQSHRTGLSGLGAVGVEDTVVVGLAVGQEGLFQLGIHLELVGAQGRLHHTVASVGVDDALQRLVGLETYDDLIVAVDVARLKIINTREVLGVHADRLAGDLFLNQGIDLVPDGLATG